MPEFNPKVRLFLAVAGMVSIGMGISIAISLSSLLGFFWTPMHPALPLLCLGRILISNIAMDPLIHLSVFRYWH